MSGDRPNAGGAHSETVTVTFITNHEVDPDKVDLRYNDLRNQLRSAIVPGTGKPQEVLGVTDDALEETRRRIWEAKHGSE